MPSPGSPASPIFAKTASKLWKISRNNRLSRPFIAHRPASVCDNRTLTPGDDLDRIRQTLDYVAMLQRSHDEQIGKLVEQADRNE